MSYQVLARKCRPQRFSEIVGQRHITQTLQNAIIQERVGHAYLFVGPRGTGKTTTARIFAKALNCEKGIVSEPCCECQSCLEIAGGSSLDVMEIDGASHNKVEHVRDLRDNVQYTPNRSRYKVYIIDEVHMLTPQAWNALLKTLEEPPPHVKFFFATTEPHKVLPTIVSRCQRFDLKRLSVPLIAGRLKQIAESENILIDERALVAIARAADGAMRDGQSIFDQIIAFCDRGTASQSISEDDVINVFGLASGRELTDLAKGAANNDIQTTIQIIHDLAERGRDLERLFGDLILFLRNAMVYQVCDNPQDILDLSDAELADIREFSETADSSLVQRLLEGLAGEQYRFRNALNKRVFLEVALVQVMYHAHNLQIDKIISRLNELRGTELPNACKSKGEENTGGGPSRKEDSPAPGQSSAQAGGKNTAKAKTPAPVINDEPGNIAIQQESVAKPPRVENKVPQRQAATEPDVTVAEGTDNYESQTSKAAVKPASDSLPAPSGRQEETMTPPPASETAEITAENAVQDTNDPALLWHRLIETVGKIPHKHQLKTYMQEMRPVNFESGKLHIAYDNEFPEEHVKLLLQGENLKALEKSLDRLTGSSGTQILIKRWVEGVSNENRKRRLVSSPEIRERLQQNPFVQKVQNLFNAELYDVRG